MDNPHLKIRLFLWTLVLGALFWLGWLKVVPTGEITYTLNSGNRSDHLGVLKPNDRLASGTSDMITIIGNPVYFTLRPPRPFETVDFTIKYKNSSKLPLIEAGILADGKLWRYKTEPIENHALDQMSISWDTIKENDLMLLQKEIKYKSIKEFLDKPPAFSEVAIYNYDFKNKYEIVDYQASDAIQDIGNFKGAWQFYTYIKDEILDVNVSFRDINLDNNLDTIELFLYYGGKVVDSRVIDDIFVGKEGTGEEVDAGSVGFELSDMPEGIYKVELRAGGDIVSHIRSKQSKLSFIGEIALNEEGKNFDIYTNSRKIQITTDNPGSLQDVGIVKMYSPNSSFADVLKINETYRQFESKRLEGISDIKLEKDGVIISGDGTFAFNEEALFNPEIRKIDGETFSKEDNIGYIIARYDFPKWQNNWQMATAKFDLTKAYQEDGKYGLMISIPGLRADDDIADHLEIGEISVKFRGKSLWKKILEIIN